MKKIIVIGSGFGGLAAAIRLQANGFKVTIFEKNERVGGHAYQLNKGDYTFDMGPSLITAPDIVKHVFTAAGKRMEDYLDLIPLDPFYRVYFHDGTFIDYSGDAESMKKQMAQFNVHDANQYDRFMNDIRHIYDAVITDGLGGSPFMDLKTLFGFAGRALKLNALRSVHAFTKKYFKDSRHRFLFSFHPLFIGGNPFRTPSVYIMIPYLEKTGGVYFTKGGMYSVVEAFRNIFTELGGIISTLTPVESIVVHERRALGVIAGGDFFSADAVVSNADVSFTYRHLIREEHRQKWTNRKLDRRRYSMSAFLLYLGVRKQYPELLHHTLILSPRYRELIADIFDKKILPDDFSMYLHAPTRTDASMAPPGCESLYVLIPVANLQSRISWKEAGPKLADRLIAFFENESIPRLRDLRKNIDVMEIFTPEDFLTLRNSVHGSPWGMEPTLTQTAYFRPHNRSEDIENLYFVGAGTHPGAGVPGVLLSAEATEKVILNDFNLLQPHHRVKEYA